MREIEDKHGHSFVWVYRGGCKGHVKVGNVEAYPRQLCVVCGCTLWEAAKVRAFTRPHRSKLGEYRRYYAVTQLRGHLILPFGEVPKWGKLSIRYSKKAPPCEPAPEGLHRRLSNLRELAEKMSVLMDEVVRAENEHLQHSKTLIENTAELLQPTVDSAKKEASKTQRQRNKQAKKVVEDEFKEAQP